MNFVGLDWGSQAHAVCVVDEHGTSVASFPVPHSDDGFKQLLRELKRFEDVSIAIERPDGVLVDTLLEAGHRIVPIHPNILKATRSRHRTAGKSDPGDAYILADLLRTDGHRFKTLTPHSAEVQALRIVSRSRTDLVQTRVVVGNQLYSLLERTFPGANRIFGKLHSPISLAFLRKYPTQAAADKLDEKRLDRFLRRHSYPGRRSAAELLERLRTAPHPELAEPLQRASATSVLALVAVIEQLVEEIATLNKELEVRSSAIPEMALIQSFPGGGGTVNSATIVTKLGQDRSRFQTADQMASIAGATPVTFTSGKQRGVVFRRHCDKEFRAALNCLANASRKTSPWAAEVYRQARSRGCDHPHAIRILGRAWARVIWRCWQDRVPYDPTAHGRAVAVAAQLAA